MQDLAYSDWTSPPFYALTKVPGWTNLNLVDILGRIIKKSSVWVVASEKGVRTGRYSNMIYA